jgi:hypothetical protein
VAPIVVEAYAINIPGYGGINLSTVSPTRRGAIVRLLLQRGYTIGPDHDDDAIEMIWQSIRESDGEKAYCIKIEISAVQGADANVSERPQR